MSTLTISQEKNGDVDIVTLNGLLNADTSSKLEMTLEHLSDQTKPLIIMNLPDLSYISSAGIGCFIGVIKSIRRKNGDIRFCNMTAKVKRVFQLLDMEDFFQFFNNIEEAIKSYKTS